MNGLTPKVAFHLMNIYIIPIVLHGMDVLLPTEAQLAPLTKLYEDTMRHILGLADSVAKPAPYFLLGALPLQAQVHRNALALLGGIIAR